MRADPSKPSFRRRLQTTLSCAGKKSGVVSVKEKAQEMRQVSFKETNESKLLMTCRNTKMMSKPDFEF